MHWDVIEDDEKTGFYVNCLLYTVQSEQNMIQLRFTSSFISIVLYIQLSVFFISSRQMKDQNKKVATLKHKEQVEKKKNAQLLEEARRREDNLTDSSQQLQVACT